MRSDFPSEYATTFHNNIRRANDCILCYTHTNTQRNSSASFVRLWNMVAYRDSYLNSSLMDLLHETKFVGYCWTIFWRQSRILTSTTRRLNCIATWMCSKHYNSFCSEIIPLDGWRNVNYPKMTLLSWCSSYIIYYIMFNYIKLNVSQRPDVQDRTASDRIDFASSLSMGTKKDDLENKTGTCGHQAPLTSHQAPTYQNIGNIIPSVYWNVVIFHINLQRTYWLLLRSIWGPEGREDRTEFEKKIVRNHQFAWGQWEDVPTLTDYKIKTPEMNYKYFQLQKIRNFRDDHLNGMQDTRITEEPLQYKPRGKRNHRGPRKQWVFWNRNGPLA